MAVPVDGPGVMDIEPAKRVLVVDGDAAARGALKSALVRFGITADEASDGGSAVVRMRDSRYAVLVVDFSTAAAGDASLLEEIGRLEVKPRPVVLMLTTPGEKINSGTLDPRLIHGVIRKPFDPDEIAAVVDACSEIRLRMNLEAMVFAAIVAGAPLFS